jgi:hypothetical protein
MISFRRFVAFLAWMTSSMHVLYFYKKFGNIILMFEMESEGTPKHWAPGSNI